MVREEGIVLEPVDHCIHWNFSPFIRSLVSAQGRSLDLPWRDGHDLSGEHLGASDRLLLLEQGQQLGCGSSNPDQRSYTNHLSRDGTTLLDRQPGKDHWAVLLGHRHLFAIGCRDGDRLTLKAAG